MSHYKFTHFIESMENIFTVVKPFYILAKVLGLFPMSYEGLTNKGKLTFKWRDAIPACLSLALQVTLLVMVLKFADEPASSSTLINQIWIIQCFVAFIFLFLLFIYQIGKCKSIANFLHPIYKIDERVRKFWLTQDWPKKILTNKLLV